MPRASAAGINFFAEEKDDLWWTGMVFDGYSSWEAHVQFRIFVARSEAAASRLAAGSVLLFEGCRNREGDSPFLIGNGAAHPVLGKSNRSPSRRVWVRAIQLSDIRA